MADTKEDGLMADPYALPASTKLDSSPLAPGLGASFSLPPPQAPQIQPDFLFPENFDESYRRSWGERLTFHVGSAYLAGLSSGSAVGLVEGLRSSQGERRRIRINSVLNSIGRRGPGWGNGLGCVGELPPHEPLPPPPPPSPHPVPPR